MSKVQAHLFLVAASMIYGCNFVISKLAMPQYITPYAFIFLRIIGAAVLFTLLHTFTVKEKIEDKKDYKRLFLAAVFGACVNQLLFFEGLAQTSPINASVIVVTSPVIVLTLSFIFLKEKVTPLKIIGISIGFIGAILMIGLNGIAFHSGSVKGDIMVLVNAILYSVYLVISKPLLAKYHPFTVMKWIFILAVPMVTAATWQDVIAVDWKAIPLPIWGAIAYVVICTSFLAYLFYAIAMRVLNASTASFYIYFQPVVATIVAIIVFDESLKTVQVMAAALIFTGVYLVSIKKKQKKSTN
ncbi:DMT family transporter [Flammeovirga agarivorans]|uniref:DMT family transporter n=1 Tax=Flammeovirga agarivorans TaxID=2726742 RepID=A0A7X8XXA9_9BACT|nr:DMT family transporter [Flammeovirga agarivorans]NLR92915.1 DMT family transporter [Flammeovirga agarivorans]